MLLSAAQNAVPFQTSSSLLYGELLYTILLLNGHATIKMKDGSARLALPPGILDSSIGVGFRQLPPFAKNNSELFHRLHPPPLIVRVGRPSFRNFCFLSPAALFSLSWSRFPCGP